MTPDRPGGGDLVVVGSGAGYLIRRYGTEELVEGAFTVFGNAITAARRVAAMDGVSVWLRIASRLHLVARAEDWPTADGERRRHRLVVPPCHTCGSADVDVVRRSPFRLLLRCSACGCESSACKPGLPPLAAE